MDKDAQGFKVNRWVFLLDKEVRMNSHLSEIIKIEDPSIRYKDCEGFMKLVSVYKKPSKNEKVKTLSFRIFRTTWGEVSLN